MERREEGADEGSGDGEETDGEGEELEELGVHGVDHQCRPNRPAVNRPKANLAPGIPQGPVCSRKRRRSAWTLFKPLPGNQLLRLYVW